MAGVTRCRGVVVALALVACQDANRIEVLPDAQVAAPRVFTWRPVLETVDMSDGVFVNDHEAWVVGPYGTVLHTTNGGAKWDEVRSDTTSQLGPIAAVSTAGGSFALVIGTNVVIGTKIVLRYSADRPGWERLDLTPTGQRPSLHVAAGGRVEAWLATLDGFAHASDARTGPFTKAEVPRGATQVIFSDDGDSWTIAPVGRDCVPYRRPRGEVDWHPAPIPPPGQPPVAQSSPSPGNRPGSNARKDVARTLSTQACSGVKLVVTLQSRRLWCIVDEELSGWLAEWDGTAWTRYEAAPDVSAVMRSTLPPGGVRELIYGDREFVMFPHGKSPTFYRARQPADPDAALLKDPREHALSAWGKTRTVRFNVQDLWMRGREVWAVGRRGFARSPDGGETWSIGNDSLKVQALLLASGAVLSRSVLSRIQELAPFGTPQYNDAVESEIESAVEGGLEGRLPRKLALDESGRQGWAVSDDGNVFHYDGAWHVQLELKIEGMQHVLGLSLSDGGNVAWVLGRDKLYRLTLAGSTPIEVGDGRDAMEALLVCPDGRSGWIRHDGDQWYSFNGTSWAKSSARPSPACISARCAEALAHAEPDTVVCAAEDQIWSLQQGQTADGTWSYPRPIPGLEPLQNHAGPIRADSSAVPTRMLAVSQDGTLLRTDGYTDQLSIVDPSAVADGSDVVLSWALSGASAVEPTWDVQFCEAYVDGICAPDGTGWKPDSEVRPTARGGRYVATVSPSKLRFQPDTKVRYRVRMTLGGLARKPVLIAELTLGESPIAAAWGVVRPYVASAALWFTGLFGLWLFAPYALLRINDSTRNKVSEIPVFGNAIGSLAGVLLARELVRTRRVVSSWTSRALRPADAATEAAGGAAEPTGFSTIKDAELRGAFHAMARCQAAWIELHIERAARTFEGGKFASERATYGEASVTIVGPGGAQKLARGLGLEDQAAQAAWETARKAQKLARGLGLEDMRALVAPRPRDPKLVVWIRGQGGVGKSHLACRIARWMFHRALLPHPALVVVIDGNAETREALGALIRERLAALTQATDVDASLVDHLLAAGRVVLLFDGLTERSPRTIEAVHGYLESPEAPALAICTARSAHGLTARRSVMIEPMLLDAEELLPFLSSYRLSLPPAQRRSEELLEPVRKAAKRIAEGERRTPLTPLLVTLLWDEAVAGGALSSLAVEAFNGYVARALVPAANAADVAEQRRLALARARVLGRLALGKNYRPGRWFTRQAAVDSLRAAGVGAAEHDVVHDFVAAGLLEEDSGGDQLRFLLDPLSEYLCALAILYAHDGKDAEWDELLAALDAMSPEARAAADGFLVALADGWAAYGSSLQLTRGPRVSDVLPAER